MISKDELAKTAGRTGVALDIVQKDYVLGWALAGIYTHEELAGRLVFKGGTCLKKCWFEDYRFSEDLDFTVIGAPDDGDWFTRVFNEAGEQAQERSGIEFAGAVFRRRPAGNSFRGAIGFRGPAAPGSGDWPRIRLDLNMDEIAVLGPVQRPVFHPYSDAPEGGFKALTYAYAELFAEKIRALAGRGRPRDLYDVISIYRNAERRPPPAELLEVLVQKCRFRNIGVPAADSVESLKSGLESSWSDMLDRQLPELPPFKNYWEALPEFFDWLYSARPGKTPRQGA